MYNDKLYIPEYENENNIFYFVREPSLKSYANDEIDDYVKYLKFMEGSANTITLENYCYEGILILDGSFTIPVDYYNLIKIGNCDKKINTIDNRI
jgi:hypothetical protein